MRDIGILLCLRCLRPTRLSHADKQLNRGHHHRDTRGDQPSAATHSVGPSYFQPPYIGYRGFSRVSACSITNCRDGVGGAPWSPAQDLNPDFVVRSHTFCPVRLTEDKLGVAKESNLLTYVLQTLVLYLLTLQKTPKKRERLDLNQRPSGYEPDELPTAPLRVIIGKGIKWRI